MSAEALHPETKHGAGTGGRASRTKDEVANFATPNAAPAERFTEATAKAIGKSERAVRLDAQRGEVIGPEALNRIKGAPRSTMGRNSTRWRREFSCFKCRVPLRLHSAYMKV